MKEIKDSFVFVSLALGGLVVAGGMILILKPLEYFVRKVFGPEAGYPKKLPPKPECKIYRFDMSEVNQKRLRM